MEVPSFWRVIWCTVWVCLLVSYVVHSAPITVDFTPCLNATYELGPGVFLPPVQCCPLLPTRPIIDGLPPPTTSVPRVRMASQCTDADYADKLHRAYALMRALPDDDPRSFFRQWETHCAYCGGSFLTYNSTGGANGIDIHFSWLFLPWHRYYLYFHERILQSLLGDPTFSLNYWNWDNWYSTGDGTSKDGVCLARGSQFPALYSDPTKATFDSNRSADALGLGHLDFPGLFFDPTGNPNNVYAAYLNATADEVIRSNMNVHYNTMVSAGTTAEAFMGFSYRQGDLRGEPTAPPALGGGAVEFGGHPAVHFFVGTHPPDGINIDMGTLQVASRDPAFFAHHSNVDRNWEVWKTIGPLVGSETHVDFTDPDFLNAEFLFYDENKDLRRVKVKDGLDTKNLGYVYQEAPISQWLYVNRTMCSSLNYTELIAEADTLPVPVKDSSGRYNLVGGETFNIEISRPDNAKGLEEFLTIDGLTLDRNKYAAFDVFVNLLNPASYAHPYQCPEYAGRFTNMVTPNLKGLLKWRQSITKQFVDLLVPESPAKVLITLVTLSMDCPSVSFTDIRIDVLSP